MVFYNNKNMQMYKCHYPYFLLKRTEWKGEERGNSGET